MTPYSGAPQVSLLQQTWSEHLQYHPELEGLEQTVQSTLSAPSLVCAGTSDQRNVVFVNQNVTSSHSRSPFVVIVNPEAALVDSMGYRQGFRKVSPEPPYPVEAGSAPLI